MRYYIKPINRLDKKMHKIVPVCSYKGTIVLVDDDVDFLKSITEYLSVNGYKCISFYNPTEAIAYLNDSDYHLFEEIYQLSFEDRYEYSTIEINTGNMYEKIFDQDRYKTHTVLIVDYDMPSINGLDFLKKIQDKYIHKIMLTGAVDNDIAVDAFNMGLINNFSKKDFSISKEILKAVDEGNRSFFNSISEHLVNVLSSRKNKASLLGVIEFVVFFGNILKKYNIVEYYLFQSIGGFLLIDEERNMDLLYISESTEDANSAILDSRLVLDARLYRDICIENKEKLESFSIGEIDYHCFYIQNVINNSKLKR